MRFPDQGSGSSARRHAYHFVAAAVSFLLGAGLLLYAPSDSWWRTSAGDIVYVFFLYAALRIVWPAAPRLRLALVVALWASAVEMLQAFGLTAPLARLNLPAEAMLGTTFQWTDFVWYTGGLALAVTLESLLTKEELRPPGRLFIKSIAVICIFAGYY